MFRSALEKTLTAAGYKVDQKTNLYQQIEAAAADGLIGEWTTHQPAPRSPQPGSTKVAFEHTFPNASEKPRRISQTGC